MANPKLVVIQESKTGKNEIFKDTTTGEIFNSDIAVKKVKQGDYKDYTVSTDINGNEYIKRKPDGNKNTNLG